MLADPITTIFNASLKGKIDPCQFRCLKGTSTTYCLFDMLHSWLSHLDSNSNGKHIRISFLDFSKTFDRITYNILIEKVRLQVLRCGGVPPADLTNIYFALIRSILECCEVCNYAIPLYLSDELERVQKHAMHIIL
jgi:hypothetical protein